MVDAVCNTFPTAFIDADALYPPGRPTSDTPAAALGGVAHGGGKYSSGIALPFGDVFLFFTFKAQIDSVWRLLALLIEMSKPTTLIDLNGHFLTSFGLLAGEAYPDESIGEKTHPAGLVVGWLGKLILLMDSTSWSSLGAFNVVMQCCFHIIIESYGHHHFDFTKSNKILRVFQPALP